LEIYSNNPVPRGDTRAFRQRNIEEKTGLVRLLSRTFAIENGVVISPLATFARDFDPFKELAHGTSRF
jgi:hypothetical protein